MQLTVHNEGGAIPAFQLLEGMHRLRHEVFYNHLGWQVTSRSGMEVDEYDHSDAIYGAYVNDQGILEGCYRLLPTTGDYMLSKTFQGYFDQAFPHDPNIYECSRFAVHPALADRVGIQGLIRVTATLLHQQVMWGLNNNVHTIVCLTDLRFERVLKMSGLECVRTSKPVQIGKTKAVSGYMNPSLANLERINAVLRRVSDIELPRAA